MNVYVRFIIYFISNTQVTLQTQIIQGILLMILDIHYVSSINDKENQNENV